MRVNLVQMRLACHPGGGAVADSQGAPPPNALEPIGLLP
jgi:hypothetical protein